MRRQLQDADREVLRRAEQATALARENGELRARLGAAANRTWAASVAGGARAAAKCVHGLIDSLALGLYGAKLDGSETHTIAFVLRLLQGWVHRIGFAMDGNNDEVIAHAIAFVVLSAVALVWLARRVRGQFGCRAPTARGRGAVASRR